MPETASAALLPLARRIDPTVVGVAVGGGSDGNFTAAVGVPTLDGLGAVGGGAHSDKEYVEVATIPSRIRLIAGLLRQLCADDPA
jgi:glutamate carboxypeptidase